ncbi:MAG: hypothetical protein HC831_04550 [Chloroflexia bacterium]|nr:hypothetical protein [Chloroflexia bacterium]
MNPILKKILPICIFLTIFSTRVLADGGLVAFYKLGIQQGSISEVKAKIEGALNADGFEVIGSYHPAKNDSLLVVAYTRQDLIDLTLKISDRGIMAAVMRIGLVQIGNDVEISLLNPEYIFYAYLRDHAKKYEIELNQISLDIKAALFEISTEFKPFITSSLTERELKEFRFLVRNPGFDDVVELMEFSSFENGVETIRKNLQARKDGTFKVYEMVFEERKIAIFGIGLLDIRKGEANFLEKLGISHLAALPYELVLIDTSATILHGKYRFPLYWSDLSMTEYRKIYKTPRDIEETMKAITH